MRQLTVLFSQRLPCSLWLKTPPSATWVRLIYPAERTFLSSAGDEKFVPGPVLSTSTVETEDRKPPVPAVRAQGQR